jgi:histidinol dehydrogenase
MNKIIRPAAKDWDKLSKRPTAKFADVELTVSNIFNEVKKTGDKALLKYTLLFDKTKLSSLTTTFANAKAAGTKIPKELKAAIQLAKNNIEKFHTAQQEQKNIIQTTAGVFCWRESRAIEKVGLYIPGGTAPLFSTVLMLGIPAKIAGCKEIILCTPPDKNGEINPVILYTASLIGIKRIYCIGGIQAVAAMTFGTATIPAVNKIFGPGNQYVTAAKQYAQQFGVAIDMPAGPSEVLIIADKDCDAAFVAADLLSQAEHGPDSQVILLTENSKTADRVLTEINTQIKILPRKTIALKSIKNSKAIVLKSIKECIAFSNIYAPEHLILAIENAENVLPQIINAGSVFIGKYSCESAGDYASGTNHTLPTNGYAKNYSGVSLDSFVKKITFQQLTKEGIQNIGPAIELMAEAEQLFAHKNAVTLRLKK